MTRRKDTQTLTRGTSLCQDCDPITTSMTGSGSVFVSLRAAASWRSRSNRLLLGGCTTDPSSTSIDSSEEADPVATTGAAAAAGGTSAVGACVCISSTSALNRAVQVLPRSVFITIGTMVGVSWSKSTEAKSVLRRSIDEFVVHSCTAGWTPSDTPRY